MTTVDEALDVACTCLDQLRADEGEAVVIVKRRFLTRFAENQIHQNVAISDIELAVRAVQGRRVGIASTNLIGDDQIADCVRRAMRAAACAPENPDFPGLPSSASHEALVRVSPGTLAFDAEERAEVAQAMIRPALGRGFRAAGKVELHSSVLAVANSSGIRAAMPYAHIEASVLSMAPMGGSGWSDFVGTDIGRLDAVALGTEAVETAARSENPTILLPGHYSVLLAPNAVGSFLELLGYEGFSIRDVEEGNSFIAGHIGERILSPLLTVEDDGLATDGIGATFDFEGVAKKCVTIIDAGRPVRPVSDSYWAGLTGGENTGHATPAADSGGPYPSNLRIRPGGTSLTEMLSGVERGIYISRLHYINMQDASSGLVTATTRDGTFLVERGRIVRPVANFRFTQSVRDVLGKLVAVGSERRQVTVPEGSSPLVPWLLTSEISLGST